MDFPWWLIFIPLFIFTFSLRQRKSLSNQEKIIEAIENKNLTDGSVQKRAVIEDPDFGLLYVPAEIKCPMCAEFVKSEAKICRHCKSDISKHLADLRSQVNANNRKKADHFQARFQEKTELNELAEDEDTPHGN